LVFSEKYDLLLEMLGKGREIADKLQMELAAVLAGNNVGSKADELTQIIYEGVGKVAKAFYPKHVWVRSLDARTDEFRNMKGGVHAKDHQRHRNQSHRFLSIVCPVAERNGA
jgi:phosphoenolpyruvate synthase/pyruvate phosphate dikinase